LKGVIPAKKILYYIRFWFKWQIDACTQLPMAYPLKFLWVIAKAHFFLRQLQKLTFWEETEIHFRKMVLLIYGMKG
jgi:hypothetical protein